MPPRADINSAAAVLYRRRRPVQNPQRPSEVECSRTIARDRAAGIESPDTRKPINGDIRGTEPAESIALFRLAAHEFALLAFIVKAACVMDSHRDVRAQTLKKPQCAAEQCVQFASATPVKPRSNRCRMKRNRDLPSGYPFAGE